MRKLFLTFLMFILLSSFVSAVTWTDTFDRVDFGDGLDGWEWSIGTIHCSNIQSEQLARNCTGRHQVKNMLNLSILPESVWDVTGFQLNFTTTVTTGAQVFFISFGGNYTSMAGIGNEVSNTEGFFLGGGTSGAGQSQYRLYYNCNGGTDNSCDVDEETYAGDGTAGLVIHNVVTKVTDSLWNWQGFRGGSLLHDKNYSDSILNFRVNPHVAILQAPSGNTQSEFDDMSISHNGQIGDPSDIVVVNGSLNFTSDGGQVCGFNGSIYTVCGPTIDLTPTLLATTVGDATCKIANASLNYSTLDSSNSWDCSTTGTTEQVCTVGDNLSIGTHELYISCQSGDFEMNNFINANVFNISIVELNVTVFLDGLDENRTYEHGTHINLSYSSSLIVNQVNITSFQLNFSVTVNGSNTSVLIPVENYFEDKINGTLSVILSTDDTVTYDFEDWYDFIRLNVNLTDTDDVNPTDISLEFNGEVTKQLAGTIVNGSLQKYTLADGLASDSVFFTSSTDIEIINVNITTNPFINISMTLIGSIADPIPLDYTNIFNTSATDDIDEVNSSASFPTFVLDDLTTDTGDFDSSGNLDTNAYDSDNKYWKMQTSDADHIFPDTGGEAGYATYTKINLRNHNIIRIYFNYSLSSSGSGSAASTIWVGITGDLNSDTPFSEMFFQSKFYSSGVCRNNGVFICSFCPCFLSNSAVYYWLKRSAFNSNNWDVYSGEAGTNYLKTLNIPSGDMYLIGKISASGWDGGSATVSMFIREIIFGGIGANLTGDQSFSNNFSVISDNIFNTSVNISGAILTATEFKGDSDDILTYFLSPDNGTTFERVFSGAYHAFTAEGGYLKWKVNGSSTDNSTNWGVSSLDIQVISSSPSNITIDLGNNGFNEFNRTGVLNTSINITISDTNNSINTYLADNCDGLDICTVPIRFSSETIGGILIQNITINSKLNPVIVDLSNFSKLDNVTLIGNEDFNMTLSDSKVYYIGNKDNVSINLSFSLIGATIPIIIKLIDIRYSPFNVTILPQSIDFWDISSNIYTWVQNFITPFGNEDGDGNPFFNISKLGGDHSADIYISYNESVNSCATTWFDGFNTTSNSTFNVTITDSPQLLFENRTTNIQFNTSTWTNISCSAINSTLITPFFCFSSICNQCVKTIDFANCDILQ